MSGLLFASFPDPARARRAADEVARRNGDDDRPVRVHSDELDPLVAMDLAGAPAQERSEHDVLVRFTAAFALFVTVGVAIDLIAGNGAGLPATMLFGSAGVLIGTVAVLAAPLRPLDQAFRTVDEAFEQGQILVTIPICDERRRSVEYTVAAHGGRTLFAA